MIKTKKSKAKIVGAPSEILTDLSISVRAIFEGFSKRLPEEKVKEMILHAVELGLMSPEEVTAKFKAQLEKLNGGEGDVNAD